MPAYFVTGTDTDAGKTTIASALLHLARQSGLSTAAVKPVASGCHVANGELCNADALALWAECTLPLDYSEVNPVAFAPAIAPHIAAAEAGVELEIFSLQASVEYVLQRNAGFTLIEGAGGWRVPLGGGQYLSDLAIALGLPVILVVGVRLGCINHAVLTAETILRDGLVLAGWVASITDPHTASLQENLDTLQQLLPAPCLGVVPHLPQVDAAMVASYLQLPV